MDLAKPKADGLLWKQIFGADLAVRAPTAAGVGLACKTCWADGANWLERSR